MLGQSADFWDRVQCHWATFPQKLLATSQDAWDALCWGHECCMDKHFSGKLRARYRGSPTCPEHVQQVLSAVASDGCQVCIAAVERMHGRMRCTRAINLLTCSSSSLLEEACIEHTARGLSVSGSHKERLRQVVQAEAVHVNQSRAVAGGGGSAKQVFINEQDSLHKCMVQRKRSLDEMRQVPPKHLRGVNPGDSCQNAVLCPS